MADENEGGAAAQKSRHRSPNYPSIGLRAAVGKIESLYKAGGLAPLTKITALKQMGFEKAEGDAARVLSAVRNFGLIEEVGERLKLTQRGIDIVARQNGDPQRSAAIRAAVFGPPIYRELLTEYATSGVPPDAAFKSELVAAKRFNPNAVDGFIRDFRDTLEYAGLLDSGVLELPVGDQMPAMEDAVQVRLEAGVSQAPVAKGGGSGASRIVKEIFSQRVSPDCVAQVIFDGPVTQRAIEKLVAHLELAKDNYPGNGSS